MGLIQIDKLEGFIDKRISNTKKYLEIFDKYSDFLVFKKQQMSQKNSHFGFPFCSKK